MFTMKKYGKEIIVRCSYCPQIPPKAKALGGRWNPRSEEWSFDSSKEEQLISLLHGVYGDPNEEKVTVKLELGRHDAAELWKFGRLLARRRGRDLPVQLGRGVSIVDGSFPPSAGSSKYPALTGPGDRVVLEVVDVPASLAAAGTPAA